MKSTKPSFESLNIFKEIPFSSQSVPAGFPSPADDFLEFDLSLDKKLIKHPSATFFVRVSGNSMINAKIFDGMVTDNNSFTAYDLFNAGTNVLWHQKKMTTASFKNNALVVDGMMNYGKSLNRGIISDPNQYELELPTS